MDLSRAVDVIPLIIQYGSRTWNVKDYLSFQLCCKLMYLGFKSCKRDIIDISAIRLRYPVIGLPFRYAILFSFDKTQQKCSYNLLFNRAGEPRLIAKNSSEWGYEITILYNGMLQRMKYSVFYFKREIGIKCASETPLQAVKRKINGLIGEFVSLSMKIKNTDSGMVEIYQIYTEDPRFATNIGYTVEIPHNHEIRQKDLFEFAKKTALNVNLLEKLVLGIIMKHMQVNNLTMRWVLDAFSLWEEIAQKSVLIDSDFERSVGTKIEPFEFGNKERIAAAKAIKHEANPPKYCVIC